MAERKAKAIVLMKVCYLLTTVLLRLDPSQGVKEHKCGICGREFTLLANMKRHVLIHTNIRAYQCHLCYKSFVQKQTLKAHMIVHSDVKPFKCKVGGCPGGAWRGRAQRAVQVRRKNLQGTFYSVSSEGPLRLREVCGQAQACLLLCASLHRSCAQLSPRSCPVCLAVESVHRTWRQPVQGALRVEGPFGE